MVNAKKGDLVLVKARDHYSGSLGDTAVVAGVGLFLGENDGYIYIAHSWFEEDWHDVDVSAFLASEVSQFLVVQKRPEWVPSDLPEPGQ